MQAYDAPSLVALPFIIIGIDIDDMFMLALSSQILAGGSTPSAFAHALASVAVPVTMTSLVNAAMFAIMSFTSDIRIVYEASYTCLMATAIPLLTMLLSFSILVNLDSRKDGAKTFTEFLSRCICTNWSSRCCGVRTHRSED